MPLILITLLYISKPMDASLSTDTAFSLNNLSFAMWKPDYVTFSMDYQQSEETELQILCSFMTD